ncbi:hypothetical protein A6R68_03770 [Neotoma lepida]|uniref:Uncharacterized protein n=1 Tax=Neotoma lepida TaxID=56216 RepID=A0A1A6GPA2_NEOLE|nr:hypothetical protein A6R68_03770 [Neotoma lepida]
MTFSSKRSVFAILYRSAMFKLMASMMVPGSPT